MAEIHKVTVVGGAGNLGSSIVDALVAAGFAVQVLTRQASTTTGFASGVSVKKVDYADQDALVAALQGQDAVVSVVASVATGQQTALVDAAVAAKVKRFIPSEFGINTRTTKGPIIKILAGKVATVDYLIEKSKEHEWFTWTGLSTGLFFDWGLNAGSVGFNYDTKTAAIHDSGDEPASHSNLAFIGKAVAGVLKHPNETANKYLSVASFTVTQNQLLKLVEQQTGEKWNVERVKTADLQKLGEEKLAKGDFSAFLPLLKSHLYADGANKALTAQNNANSLLGLTEENVEETIRDWVARKKNQA